MTVEDGGINPSIEIDDIKSHLVKVGVVDAGRLTMVRDGVKVNTTSAVLSFGNPVLLPKFSRGIKALLYRNTFQPPEDVTSAKSLVTLLQPVGAINAAANVMESTNTEAALVKKCLVLIVVGTPCSL